VSPGANNVPPVGASYHWYPPPGAVAFSVAVPFGQVVAPEAVGALGVGAADMVILLATGLQPAVLSLTVTV
jgi:hypothetical protein